MKKRQKIMVMLMCMVLEGILLLNFTGCSVKIQAADLMQNVEANAVEENRRMTHFFKLVQILQLNFSKIRQIRRKIR